MNVRRLGVTSAIVCALVLALGMQVAVAGTNLISNQSFEIPKVPLDSFATFGTGSTLGTCGLAMPGSPGYQVGCWRVFQGDVDVVQNGFWDAKNGKQSLELNGNNPGDILQLYVAQPNRVYRFRFSLAGDPDLAGVVSVLAVQEQFDSTGTYITGNAIGTYNFDTTGHSATNMGYETVTGYFTTGQNTRYVDVELQSNTDNNSAPWWGAVIDQATVSDHGPAPQRAG